MSEIRIREMTRRDIAAGLRLCRLSEWNQTQDDWSVFLELSPEGCRVAERNGRIIGTVATLRYQDRFSWIAMMLVDPEERRTGVGTKLLREGMAVLRGERSIRLDATPAGRHLYTLEGFKEEYPLCRMTIRPQSRALTNDNSGVRSMRPEDFPAVLELDHQVFGADREKLLRNLFQRAPEYAAVFDNLGVQGYCFGRPGYLHQQIGPVVAFSEEVARRLLSFLLFSHPEKSFAIDAPQDPAWSAWLRSAGFVDARSFVRMYWGENPFPGRPEFLFGIVGPEFG